MFCWQCLAGLPKRTRGLHFSCASFCLSSSLIVFKTNLKNYNLNVRYSLVRTTVYNLKLSKCSPAVLENNTWVAGAEVDNCPAKEIKCPRALALVSRNPFTMEHMLMLYTRASSKMSTDVKTPQYEQYNNNDKINHIDLHLQ